MTPILNAIHEVARSLMEDAQLCPAGELAIRLRERAAALRCAMAALKRALEALADGEAVPAGA